MIIGITGTFGTGKTTVANMFRKYGFKGSDIIFDKNGNLPLGVDPKESWAIGNPQAFPVNVNYATKFELLKVPGLGPITVNRIIKSRRKVRFRRIEDIGKVNVRLRKADKYLVF